MTSPYSDLRRPPLKAASLRSALLVDGGLWTSLEVVPVTGSTNADLALAAAGGAAEGTVLVAEHQSTGRGRSDRVWTAPPRSGLTFSVLLRPPPVTRPRWGLVPLLTGVAVATAVERVTGVEARLKWPNDVMVEDRKLAGILAEVSGDAVVVGVGINVSLAAEELPVPTATSLTVTGVSDPDRDPLLRAVLRQLAATYTSFREYAGSAESDPLLPTYRSLCTTLGRRVTAHLPGGGTVTGLAVDVDHGGRLVVEADDGTRAELSAGDVVHLR